MNQTCDEENSIFCIDYWGTLVWRCVGGALLESSLNPR